LRRTYALSWTKASLWRVDLDVANQEAVLLFNLGVLCDLCGSRSAGSIAYRDTIPDIMNRSKGARIVIRHLIFCVSLILVGVCVLAHGETTTVRSILESEGLKIEAAPLEEYLDLDLDAAAERDLRAEQTKVYGNVLCVKTLDGKHFRFNVDTGRLMSCFKEFGTPSDATVPKAGTEERWIAEEEALDIARDFLEALDVDIDLEEATVRASGFDSNQQPTSDSARWKIFKIRSYKGIACESHVSVAVSARSGRITQFRDLPLVVPKTLEQTVTREEAIETVKDFVEEKGTTFALLGGRRETTLYIVHPSNYWAVSDLRDVQTEPTTRLAWRLRIVRDHGPLISFDVDCVTGEIIGGGGTLTPQSAYEEH
jgi:hypothetical protein